jgi:isopenicillin N synthase-like dioxygenase
MSKATHNAKVSAAALSMLRINYYPPQPPQSDGSQVGIGAHTDYECFTILAQQPHVTALQIWNGFEWIAAASLPGTFVVNIGDQMQRWTNDNFFVHPPPRHQSVGQGAVVDPIFFSV